MNSKESWNLGGKCGDRPDLTLLCLLQCHELKCMSLMKITMTVMTTLLVYPWGNDLPIDFLVFLPKQGINTDLNSIQNILYVAPMLQMNNIYFYQIGKMSFCLWKKRKDIV